MKRFRSVQTRPNITVQWPYKLSTSTMLSLNPDLISKTITLSEDQLVLVTDFMFPDSWNYETVSSDPDRVATQNSFQIREYQLEHGITYSYSVDDV